MKFKKYLIIIAALSLMMMVGCQSTNETAEIATTSQTTTVDTTAADITVTETTTVADETSVAKDTLVLISRELNYTFDPTKPQTDGYFRRSGALEALFHIEADGSVVPWLAEEGTMVDKNTWEVKLRDNATFWSGKPVTADAVIACIDRTKSEHAGVASALENVVFEAKDEFLIEIKTERDNMDLPLTLAEVSIYSADETLESFENIDFTGMYKIVEYKPKQRMVLKRNESYYGEKPTIENIIYEAINDNDARLNAALSGTGDIVTAIPVTGAKQVEDADEMVVYVASPSGTLEVYLNHDRPALNDVKVRQALSWATDRQELVMLASEGYGQATSTWLGSNPMFSDKEKNAVYTEYNIEKANALLDEAGWVKGADGFREKDGEPLTFKLYTWGSEKTLGETLQYQWAKIGVKVEANHVDWSVIEESWDTGDWDGFVASWNHYGDMVSIIADHYAPEGQFNYSNYQSQALVEKLDALRAEADKTKQKDMIWDINLLLAEDAVRIPLMPRVNVTAVKKELKGFVPHFMIHPNVITNKLYFEE